MARARSAAQVERVVGVGASAGGLLALEQLVANLTADSGHAYVVLQHLPPSQTGALAKLLATKTSLRVQNVTTGTRIEPNTIYVVPPRTSAALSRGALVLRRAPGETRPRHPIDDLFTSLATSLGDRAIGVVLSGTANDGTEGLRAIRAAGGRTFAQDPSTAQFDEMPRSAIAANAVELVLTPKEIGEWLGGAGTPGEPPPPIEQQPPPPVLAHVFAKLREVSGIDFGHYKRTTIERRIARRLAKHRLESLEDYGAFIDSHPDEIAALADDLLTHVTEYFRDPEVLDELVRVLVDAVRDRPADQPVRVWIAGCSTGEEVYSLAMLLVERLGDKRPIQLFGTDLSERVIDIARSGRYSAAIAKQVGEQRLARFFRRSDGGYQIKQDVRERCVFARHDLVTDPPFSKLDLVSCRNLLIYLGPSLQRRVIPLVHYSLNQPGFLLLGRAETIGEFDQLFSTVNAEARIYARRPGPRASLTFPGATQVGRFPATGAPSLRSVIDVQRDIDHVLLARYSPPCVLVDENFDVIQFRGHTGTYLEAPPGHPQLNVVRMARSGLAAELPLALQRAQRTGVLVRKEDIVVRDGRREHRFHVEVVPVRGTTAAKHHYLIVFEAAADVPVPARKKKGATRVKESTEVQRLHHELLTTREHLHSVVTQHVATSEELGLINEELQSTNEELQSSSEEIQTAKEELHSTNEELETLNEELHRGNQQLREANDDLVNVLASVEIAMIIVDTERRVRRFTPQARTVMSLIASDLGRPIADLQPTIVIQGLDAIITKVIETLEMNEREVTNVDGTAHFRMQIRPYRTLDQSIGGAVLSFVDITALHAARELPAAIVETVPTPLAVLDANLVVQSANRACSELFRTPEAQLVGRDLLEIGSWTTAELGECLRRVTSEGTGFADLRIEYAGNLEALSLRVTATPFQVPGSQPAILVGIADVTKLDAAQRERDAFLDVVSHELRTPLSAILLWAQALRSLGPDDPQRTEAIETIIESVRSEASLVDDLLEIAMSRTTELPMDLEPTNPSEVVTRAVEAVRDVAKAKQVTLELDAGRGRPLVLDPRRIDQIAAKLISNAIKFTPAGGTVSVVVAYPDGALHLKIRDTGRGIPPELVSSVFEPFTKRDGSYSRAQAGLGIGLALVRHLVERHGGTIEVDSPGVGQGTSVSVHIPGR